jgi:tetratricopeptide (TPR) repeat protein
MTDAARDPRLDTAAGAIEAGDWGRAEQECLAVLAAKPEDPAALNLLGMIAFAAGQIGRAVELIAAASARDDHEPAYHRNLCELYRLLDQSAQAIAHGEAAVALDPANKHAFHRLSVAYQADLRVDAAEEAARRAIELDPDYAQAHFHLADILLIQGRFAEGGAEFEWRWHVDNAPPQMAMLSEPAWQGEILEGETLLLHGNEGLGDTLQFARYIPQAASRSDRVIVACQPALAPILSALPGVDAVVTDWRSLPSFDRHCAIASLPFVLGATVETIIPPMPFVTVDPIYAELWRARLAVMVPPNLRRVGIVWAGSKAHPNDAARSMPLSAFAPITTLGAIALISLQTGDEAAQLRGYVGTAPVVDRTHELYSLADTIALIDALDLVITVDTMIGHLAATMGKPVWLLLAYVPDWRWFLHRSDSPWYPTMRLFRQTSPKDWPGVMSRVAAELQRLQISPRYRDRP